jgi:hypothetical protein
VEDTSKIHTLLNNIETIFTQAAYGDDDSLDMLDFIGDLAQIHVEERPPSLKKDQEEEEAEYRNYRSYALRTAEQHVNGARNVDYGDPISDFRTTATLWAEYLRRVIERRDGVDLQPHDVAAMMMLLKISRLSWSPEVDDHWIDAAGYAACGLDCTKRQGQ